ncbi:MAG TPA: CBS domain-containing protein [Acidimicrobiales bacterium]|nr:CBS domain-containing protein [Acidimicrobiales bacterium]
MEGFDDYGYDDGLPDPVARARDELLASPVTRVMTAPAEFADPELTLRETAGAMVAHGLGSLILLRGDGPSAIITERDVVAAVADGVNPELAWAADVASEEVIALEPTDTVQEAVEQMAVHGVHHLPVRRDGTVIGVVSVSDLVVALTTENLAAPSRQAAGE